MYLKVDSLFLIGLKKDITKHVVALGNYLKGVNKSSPNIPLHITSLLYKNIQNNPTMSK